MLSNKFRFFIALLGLGLGGLGLGGCASNTPPNANVSKSLEPIVNYYHQLPSDHPDRLETFFSIPEHAKQRVKREFGHHPKSISGTLLARWLMAPEDQNLNYDINANLTPSEVYRQRRGNCLSFSLLLLQLAKELDIELQINQVDLADMWGQNDDQDLVLYRHVNTLRKTRNYTQIYDLALENYRPGLPQRVLTESQGAALLFSNIGLQLLQHKEPEQALHYLKLSISLFPENPDMWINLGAAYKKNQQWAMAEQAYLTAFKLDDSSSLGASNLDRLYRLIERPKKAEAYAKLARKARLKNPYIRFERAKMAFNTERYRDASKEIRRAIKLHSKDPQFFELSSRIKQAQDNYIAALQDLEKAHKLSSNDSERMRYANKVEMILERVKQQILAKSERRRKGDLQQRLTLAVDGP